MSIAKYFQFSLNIHFWSIKVTQCLFFHFDFQNIVSFFFNHSYFSKAKAKDPNKQLRYKLAITQTTTEARSNPKHMYRIFPSQFGFPFLMHFLPPILPPSSSLSPFGCHLGNGFVCPFWRNCHELQNNPPTRKDSSN